MLLEFGVKNYRSFRDEARESDLGLTGSPSEQ